jgi:paraquat-inducible protein A
MTAASTAQGPRRLIGPLLGLALALAPVGWFLPLFSARIPFLFREEVSVVSGLRELWALDLVLYVVVLVFAVLMPLAKGAATLWVWYRVPLGHAASALDRLAILAKLSMTEVFLLAVVIVGIKGVGIGRVEVSPGLYGFVAIAVGSLLISAWATAALASKGGRSMP